MDETNKLDEQFRKCCEKIARKHFPNGFWEEEGIEKIVEYFHYEAIQELANLYREEGIREAIKLAREEEGRFEVLAKVRVIPRKVVLKYTEQEIIDKLKPE